MWLVLQGLFHLAIPMYERVLRFFELSKRENREVPQEYQICRETAYNLSLIYKQRCVCLALLSTVVCSALVRMLADSCR